MVQSLNLIGWLACIVYSTIPLFWLAIHPRATYWRSRRRSPYRVLLPLWIAMWIVAGLVTATWRQVVLYSSLWAWYPPSFFSASDSGFIRNRGSISAFSNSAEFPKLCPVNSD